jgi:hypothetical protein
MNREKIQRMTQAAINQRFAETLQWMAREVLLGRLVIDGIQMNRDIQRIQTMGFLPPEQFDTGRRDIQIRAHVADPFAALRRKVQVPTPRIKP